MNLEILHLVVSLLDIILILLVEEENVINSIVLTVILRIITSDPIIRVMLLLTLISIHSFED